MNIIANVKKDGTSYTKQALYKMTKSTEIQRMSELAGINETIGINGYVLYEDDKDPEKIIKILAIEIHTGEIFATNSPTFISTFNDLITIMDNEIDFDIKVIKQKSKTGSREYILADFA